MKKLCLADLERRETNRKRPRLLENLFSQDVSALVGEDFGRKKDKVE